MRDAEPDTGRAQLNLPPSSLRGPAALPTSRGPLAGRSQEEHMCTHAHTYTLQTVPPHVHVHRHLTRTHKCTNTHRHTPRSGREILERLSGPFSVSLSCSSRLWRGWGEGGEAQQMVPAKPGSLPVPLNSGSGPPQGQQSN